MKANNDLSTLVGILILLLALVLFVCGAFFLAWYAARGEIAGMKSRALYYGYGEHYENPRTGHNYFRWIVPPGKHPKPLAPQAKVKK